MVNQLTENDLYENLIENNNETHEVTDEFLINSLDHQVLIEETDDDQFKYKLKISVGAFVPTDFKLKLKGKSLLIKALRERFKQQNETENKNIVSNLKEFEEFKREVALPEFVLADTVVCYLEVYENNENLLFIEGLVNETTNLNILKDYLKTENASKPTRNVRAPKTRSKKLANCSALNEKVFKSIDQITDKRVENYSSNGCLKYKFELREFESNNISISIRNKNILVVYAHDSYMDVNGKPALKEFNHEIKLPNNIELCNIRNCFDERLGVLRIELPLKFCSNKAREENINIDAEDDHVDNRMTFENDKYLELMFDLKDFRFDSIDFYKNKEDKNVLIVKACKGRDSGDDGSFIRKYVLPDWVGTENVKIFEENKEKHGIKKNLLVLNLPFI